MKAWPAFGVLALTTLATLPLRDRIPEPGPRTSTLYLCFNILSYRVCWDISAPPAPCPPPIPRDPKPGEGDETPR